jgi:hypothetical protein
MIKKRGNNKWLQTRIKYQICGFYVVLFVDKTVESFSNKEIGSLSLALVICIREFC